MSAAGNIVEPLRRAGCERSGEPAIFAPGRGLGSPTYQTHTYAELDTASEEFALGLRAMGLQKGTRVAVLIPPGFDLFAVTFGLLKGGMVPVMIDPGIGLRRFGKCLADARPKAFVGTSLAHWARILFGWARNTVKVKVRVGNFGYWGGKSVSAVRRLGIASGASLEPVEPDDSAAVLFTSGSTGAPKGVEYLHRHFAAQVEIIRRLYDIRPGEVDLPTFPLFGLFDPALGMTSVIPKIDFTRPAKADPVHLSSLIRRFGVTNMFGSPALLNTFGRYVEQNGDGLNSLKRVISAGAPVPAETMARVVHTVPGLVVHTPYGATECLPVSTISSDDVLRSTHEATSRGAGVCVGQPAAENDVRIMPISDDEAPEWHDEMELSPGEVGEIVVRGPTTTQRYFERPEATALAKMSFGDGNVLAHRMGDLGYLDETGRLWFCGRKAHRIVLDDETLYTVPCEMIFNQHAQVFRTALVGVTCNGKVKGALCVETEGTYEGDFRVLRDELVLLGKVQEMTARIDIFLRHAGFPVDIRHNAKIDRPALGRWAQKKIDAGELGVGQ